MIHLHSATLADLDLLRRWDEHPHVIASNPNDDWGWEVELNRNPDWREQCPPQWADPKNNLEQTHILKQ